MLLTLLKVQDFWVPGG